MKKILFLGSKPIGYQCLNYLVKNQSKLGGEVVGVLSNNNTRFSKESDLKVLAEENGIRFYAELDDILGLREVDIIISVQYHLILKQEHIQIAHEIAVNLHMAPLPDYRGCNQFSFAIYNGATEFGTTLHRLEAGIDNGHIIAERRFSMAKMKMVGDLYKKTYDESILLFQSKIESIISGNFTLTAQEDLIGERGTNLYFRRQIEDLKEINLDESAAQIVRKVRATFMEGFEPPYAIFEEKKYYIIPEYHHKNKL